MIPHPIHLSDFLPDGTRPFFTEGTHGGAVFSRPNRTHRYWLSRVVEPVGSAKAAPGRVAVFCGLNPSKAGEDRDDATIRREVGFARREGCTFYVKVNLFGLVSTDPKGLLTAKDPVGDNDRYLRAAFGIPGALVVAAWGAHPMAEDRVRSLGGLLTHGQLASLWCLGTTQSGAPKHPVRLAKVTPLVRWVP